MRKILYLFTALLVPGLIYVFLKYFGKNQFDIPVYYHQGVPAETGCDWTYPVPYTVPDSVLKNVGWKALPATLLVKRQNDQANTMRHIQDEIGETEFELIFLDDSDTVLSSCALLMNDSFPAVMIDDQRRIRGYYNPATREETDRLMVEMKIILKKY